MRLPVASYDQPSRNASRLVNIYAQQSLGKGPVELLSAPGIASFCTLSGPGRGLYVMESQLYAVAGTTLYRISSTGTATALGTVPGSDRLTMAGNDAGELVLSNNYWYDGASVAAVSDVDAPTFGVVDYCEGYIVATEQGTDRFYCSGLRDASAWDGLDYSGTISSSDNLVGLIVDHNQVILGGDESTEIFWLSGASGFPFERTSGGTLEIGWAAKLGATKADNTVFFLAHDRTIRSLRGATPVRVSHHAVEEKLASYASVSDAVAFSWAWQGHLFVAWRFPSAGACWVLDVTTQEWHERSTYGSDDWDVADVVHCYGKVFVQSSSTGNIGYLDGETYTEFGGILRRSWTYPAVYGANQRLTHSRLELVLRTGDAPVGTTPLAMLEKSDDGGNTWLALPSREVGNVGEYDQRIRWNRLGTARDRVYRVSVSDAIPVRVLDTTLEVQGQVA